MRFVSWVAVVCFGMSMTAVAQVELYGTWKQDMKRSVRDWQLLKFESVPSGLRYVDDSTEYVFPLDGTPVDQGRGKAVAWTQVDARTLRCVSTKEGKVTDTEVYTLSPDGQTLTNVSSSPAVMERVGSGSGFTGTWRIASESSGEGNTLPVSAATAGSVKWGPYVLSLDGKDTQTGGPEHTMSIKPEGPKSWALTIKDHGKLTWEMTATVIEGGKVLALWIRGAKLGDAGTDYYVKQ